MSNATRYGGTTQRIRSGGGAVKVTIASNVGQGNGGTSLPCAGCWVSAASANTGIVKMNVGVAASVNAGIELCEASAGPALWVPIDDVSKLYFYAANNNDIVDIVYLKG